MAKAYVRGDDTQSTTKLAVYVPPRRAAELNAHRERISVSLSDLFWRAWDEELARIGTKPVPVESVGIS